MELCLFEGSDPDRSREIRRVEMEALPGGRFRAGVPGAGPGQLYGYRVHGPWAPERGHRFNPAKLLVDPWARAVAGNLRWDAALLGSEPSSAGGERPSTSDSAPFVPRSMVVGDELDGGDDRRPATPWRDTVIYECHVKGMTRRHPELPAALRGTYLGLAHEAVVDHLRGLGVTAVELLPVHQIGDERHLLAGGRTNYFGYSPLALLAPHAGYAAGGAATAVSEFRQMVGALHRAGLEVILDVVLNHTCEGDHRGPTLSLRGLDNRAFYRLDPRRPERYVDWTGCGNTLDLGRAAALELALDCLRYWALEMRVDGFRFDLATALGRRADGRFDRQAPFFHRLAADPVLSRRKLIAEPWDLGPRGHRAGAFPDGWLEWDDRFRDGARRFWRGEPGAGSRLVEVLAPRPPATVSFVTAHDGFTLADLVSYEAKHNEANGEGNRDGSDRNFSRNWGVEGPTDDPEIRDRRDAARRCLLATLALAPGVPMLAHGDELGRTQRGNNNAYCHDGELTWVDWSAAATERPWLDFVRRAFAVRRRVAPAGTAPGWLERPDLVPDPAGEARAFEATSEAAGEATIEVPLEAQLAPQPAGWLLLVNPGDGPRELDLPAGGWRLALASFEGPDPAATIRLPATSIALLERIDPASG